ncbi:hypothetical protein KDA23_02880 [Candidatus Saccharibacteria bacterium]|nr:hypothetical protein [Candidatus Saccharibacteria bacterium]
MIEVHMDDVPASYANAGVDVHAGDVMSQIWNNEGEKTYGNRTGRLGEVIVYGSGFTSTRAIDLDQIQGQFGLGLLSGVDGVGTKPEIAERATEARRRWLSDEVEERGRDHRGISFDTTAMVTDDLARDGGEPIAIDLLFDASSLNHEDAEAITRELAAGAVEACMAAGVILQNGETAELGDRVGGYEGAFHYNLGGFVIGAVHRDRIITGADVRPGQRIVAIQEDGFRANGISLVRKVLAAQFGSQWHMTRPDLAASALTPSKIYSQAMVEMHGGYDLSREPGAHVSAIAHITGGGIPGKLQRKLAASGHGAVLEDLFAPPPVMHDVQEWSMYHQSLAPSKNLATPDTDLYQTLNGGNGLLVVTETADEVIAIAARHGINAKVAGEIVKDPGIELKSKGVTNFGEWIRYIPRVN